MCSAVEQGTVRGCLPVRFLQGDRGPGMEDWGGEHR